MSCASYVDFFTQPRSVPRGWTGGREAGISRLRKYTRRRPLGASPQAAKNRRKRRLFVEPSTSAVAGGPGRLSCSRPAKPPGSLPGDARHALPPPAPARRRDRVARASRPGVPSSPAEARLPARRASRPTMKRRRLTGCPGADSAHAAQDLVAQVGELVRPHGRAALDREDAAAETPRGARRRRSARRRRGPRRRRRAPGRSSPGGRAPGRRISPMRRRLGHAGAFGSPAAGRRVPGQLRQRSVQRQLDHRGARQFVPP